MGYYKCIRCGGTATYMSLETVGFSAISVDTPGPVDHTLVNANKREIARCRACGEKAQYIMSSAEAAKDKKKNLVTGIGTLVLFIAVVIWGVWGGGFEAFNDWNNG